MHTQKVLDKPRDNGLGQLCGNEKEISLQSLNLALHRDTRLAAPSLPP